MADGQPIRKLLELDKLNYLKVHLSFINCLLPNKMTPMEISVLAAFMTFDGELIEQMRFTTPYRKLVMKMLNLTPASLSNHIGNLEDKNFIRPIDGSYRIWPL